MLNATEYMNVVFSANNLIVQIDPKTRTVEVNGSTARELVLDFNYKIDNRFHLIKDAGRWTGGPEGLIFLTAVTYDQAAWAPETSSFLRELSRVLGVTDTEALEIYNALSAGFENTKFFPRKEFEWARLFGEQLRLETN